MADLHFSAVCWLFRFRQVTVAWLAGLGRRRLRSPSPAPPSLLLRRCAFGRPKAANTAPVDGRRVEVWACCGWFARVGRADAGCLSLACSGGFYCSALPIPSTCTRLPPAFHHHRYRFFAALPPVPAVCCPIPRTAYAFYRLPASDTATKTLPLPVFNRLRPKADVERLVTRVVGW